MTFSNADVVVCDPCYVMYFDDGEAIDELWDEFTGMVFDENDRRMEKGTCQVGDAQFLFTSTAHGDGAFTVEKNAHVHNDKFILVDSAYICVIRAEDAVKINPKFKPEERLLFKNFSGTIRATGVGLSGDITVNT